jgi:hypothetical protein
MGDFIRQQFDKLVVALFLLLSAFFLLYLIQHHTSDQSNTNQAWGVVQFFLGLFGGLVTGRVMGKADKPELTPSQPTAVATTPLPPPTVPTPPAA